jgi:hypothetical protein
MLLDNPNDPSADGVRSFRASLGRLLAHRPPDSLEDAADVGRLRQAVQNELRPLRATPTSRRRGEVSCAAPPYVVHIPFSPGESTAKSSYSPMLSPARNIA